MGGAISPIGVCCIGVICLSNNDRKEREYVRHFRNPDPKQTEIKITQGHRLEGKGCGQREEACAPRLVDRVGRSAGHQAAPLSTGHPALSRGSHSRASSHCRPETVVRGRIVPDVLPKITI